jgi:hypothetical protein
MRPERLFMMLLNRYEKRKATRWLQLLSAKLWTMWEAILDMEDLSRRKQDVGVGKLA